MEAKRIHFIWVISLFAIGITTILLVGGNLVKADLPDHVVRICGTIDLVSLAVFAFSTVKKVKNRK